VAWRFFTAGGVAQTGEYGELAANAVTSAKILDGTIVNADIAAATITNAKLATPGIVVQMVNTQTGAVATGTTSIPLDDTIPQITEGDQYMSLAITPKNASNILIIEAGVFLSTNTNDRRPIAALFVGSTSNALTVSSSYTELGTEESSIQLMHKMTASVTTELTFTIRAGANTTQTLTFNGVSASRRFGDIPKSYITITEFTP